MFGFSLDHARLGIGELGDGSGFAQATLEHRRNKKKAGAIKRKRCNMGLMNA